MKIVFLDIDGVMKPGRCYFVPEHRDSRRGNLDPLAIDIIHRLCERTGAQVVFNSVWNDMSLREDMVKAGLWKEIIHGAYITNLCSKPGRSRLEAIEAWLSNYPSVKAWCALDDAPIPHDNAIRVNAENGISIDDYRRATIILGNEDPFVVLL